MIETSGRDPRVEAVAEALLADGTNLRCSPMARCPKCARDRAEVAVAALDAYAAREAGYPTMRDSDEADLRERIAQEIEAMADEYRTHDEIDSMQGEVKDQLHAAVRIARGTDPGKDTR